MSDHYSKPILANTGMLKQATSSNSSGFGDSLFLHSNPFEAVIHVAVLKAPISQACPGGHYLVLHRLDSILFGRSEYITSQIDLRTKQPHYRVPNPVLTRETSNFSKD
ncbi:hypothetical protein XPA_005271 [Xanthoria parietina]